MFFSSEKARLIKIAIGTYYLAAIYVTFISNRIAGDISISTYQIGQILGVVSLSGLALQPLLASRLPLLDARVGLDRIMRWHRNNAYLFTFAALLHPLFVFYIPLMSRGKTFIEAANTMTIYHRLGGIAIFLIILTIFLTVFSQKIKLNYEHWKVVHKVAYIIILLGFAHSFMLGSDIIAREPLYYWWWFVLFVALTGTAYRYIIRPIRLKKHWYTISEIISETPNVRTIRLTPIQRSDFQYKPGQFVFVRFYSSKLPPEEHNFTISSSPNDKTISFTIKELGDFTSKLSALKVGDRARIEGPFGAFTNINLDQPTVFIAGGIGITPVMSMLRYMDEAGNNTESTLLYANKTQKDIVFKQELDQLEQKNHQLKVAHILSGEEVTTGNISHGSVNQEFIKDKVKNPLEKIYFIVGPPTMISATERILKMIGVPGSQIFTEKFSLR